MTISNLALLLFFISTNSFAYQEIINNFIDCLNNRSDPNFPITATLYTYDNSSFSSVYNAYIRNPRLKDIRTTKPSLIITPLHFSHIQTAIICARKHNLEMRTRSGGHDYEGLSYLSLTDPKPFFILDTFNLNQVDVNIEDETVWVQTGATLGEVYYHIANKSNVHGLPGGVCPTVAVGGHCSGAGYGNMIRKYGLTIDNIIDAQLIDVNGVFLDRNSMGEDLFWAINGGGGASFGVVYAYHFKLVRVPPIVTIFKPETTSETKILNVSNKWLHVADKLDNDLYIRMRFQTLKNEKGKQIIHATFPSLFLGNKTRLISLMNKNFPELGLQDSDCVEMSWVESTLVYAGFPVGTPIESLLSRSQQDKRQRPFKIKSDFVQRPISKLGTETIFLKMKELQNQMITFNPLGGRLNEVSEFATPYAHRTGNIALIEYETYWSEPGEEATNRNLGSARKMHEHMSPFVSKNPRQAFFNYRDLDIGINHHGKDSSSEGLIYGVKYFKEANYKRLVMVKTKVDPDNFFRNEQSIPPMQS
ncbi:berberine bridge enzyme-like 8 [Rutidosis leptorrhynchoides]|uniref:berberine bridge enzyme-like 8 n=1 Tax=Rutidosis leptorrhynchoides TaxID=125765 RepID=UPI003A9946D2